MSERIRLRTDQALREVIEGFTDELDFNPLDDLMTQPASLAIRCPIRHRTQEGVCPPTTSPRTSADLTVLPRDSVVASEACGRHRCVRIVLGGRVAQVAYYRKAEH